MSAYYNEYIVASNNSINDNKYNASKAAKSPAYKIKKILKPLIKMIRKNTTSSKKQQQQFYEKNASYSYECYTDKDSWSSSEVEDNTANEELESKIFHEIEQCQDDAAIYIYNENDDSEIQPVFNYQRHIPVHFARTDAGTFFWTAMPKAVDADLVEPLQCYSDYQMPELQYGDRWVQA